MIQGLHHITLITADAARNVDFYTRVLGQRFVKKTVNFDDPGSYHLYYGDERGRPGSAITFFEFPGAPRGRWGVGGTHHFALTVADRDALLKWKRRLTGVDEDEGSLGTALKLPPQYEWHRAEIERTLTPLAPASWRVPAGVGR